MVLRTIVDELKDEAVDMTDGIKIFQDDGWALILPDPARPVIHVCAEADSEKAAQKLTKTFIDKIDSIL
jgi:mannose-1-phosphate guanylyltransferase/phosphomannomutase